MANILEKLITTSRERVQVHGGGTVTRRVCRTENYTVSAGTAELIEAPQGDDQYVIDSGGAGSAGGGHLGRRLPQDEVRQRHVCRDVQVNLEPEFTFRWRTDRNEGWNAGAQSIERVGGDFGFQFSVQPGNRLGVGMARSRTDNHYRSIPYCFYFLSEQFYITEMGEQVYGPFNYSADDLFSIVRIDDEVLYKRNYEVLYRSTRPSSGSMIAVAAVFMGGDKVR